MSRHLNRLSAAVVRTLKAPGRHADGGNLYLAVSKTGAKSWTFLYRWRGKATEIGLGSARDVTLAQAREKATEARTLLAAGEDPREARRPAVDASFKAVAERCIAARRLRWRHEDSAREWQRTLFVLARALGPLPVDSIKTADVLAVLRPLWKTTPETASRLRGRIEAVLDFAKLEGLRSEDVSNPARWRGHLDQALSKRRMRAHYTAMNFTDVPAFIARLREIKTPTAFALEFTILTATRIGEVVGAKWAEVDRDKAIWTIPAVRTKSGRDHRVPLSKSAVAILDTLNAIRMDEHIFPSPRRGQGLSRAATRMLLVRLEVDATTHGFRSAFRDWASETTSFPHEVCERALAHVIANKTESAYRRGDLLDKRRALMEAWAAYCEPRPDNVVTLRA